MPLGISWRVVQQLSLPAPPAPQVVNPTPAVGSVAQWNTGHVAFVDAVTPHYILITSDNFQPYGVATMPGGFSDSFYIARNSPAMPDNFIHFATPTALLLAAVHAG